MNTTNNAKILVVDDVQANTVLMKAILTKSGYDIITATNGLDTMKIVDAEKPDLIILDIMMAGMDGYEVLRTLRANDDTKNIPVVMVSALSDSKEIAKAYELGANNYITKPIVIPQLLKVVEDQIALSKR